MKVLIISPMFRLNGEYISEKLKNEGSSGLVNINLGLFYLASVAMKHGHDVSIHACCKYDFDKIFKEYNPDILLISSMDIQAASAVSMAKAAKETKKSVKIIFGGYFPTACFKQLLKKLHWIDFVVLGEGESTMDEIFSYYEGKIKSKNRIKGVAFSKKGKIIFTGHRRLIDLNKNPFPAVFLSKQPLNSLITSRGCVYNCKFCCVKNFYHRTYRRRAIKNTVEELNYIKKIGNQDFKNRIRINDDDFLISNKISSEFKIRLAKRRLNKIKFLCMMRLDQFIIPKTLEQLETLNVVSVSVGLQNISENVLNYFRIGINKSHIKKFIRVLKHNKHIDIRIFYIINSGLPEETPESLRKSISEFLNLIEGFNVLVVPGILMPYSGSEVGKNVPWDELMYFDNKGFVSNSKVSDSDLNEILSDFIKELTRRRQFKVADKQGIFASIDNLFFFLTSSFTAETKIRILAESPKWFFIAVAKKERPFNFIKKMIEQNYFR